MPFVISVNFSYLVLTHPGGEMGLKAGFGATCVPIAKSKVFFCNSFGNSRKRNGVPMLCHHRYCSRSDAVHMFLILAAGRVFNQLRSVIHPSPSFTITVPASHP